MIGRAELIAYIGEEYGVSPDYPWARTPNFAIFRHPHNHKWFCALMDLTEDKLGLAGTRLIDALNLKCDPVLIGSLRNTPGIFPAYHMNKEHWITVVLSGEVTEETLHSLIDLSYMLTQ